MVLLVISCCRMFYSIRYNLTVLLDVVGGECKRLCARPFSSCLSFFFLLSRSSWFFDSFLLPMLFGIPEEAETHRWLSLTPRETRTFWWSHRTHSLKSRCCDCNAALKELNMTATTTSFLNVSVNCLTVKLCIIPHHSLWQVDVISLHQSTSNDFHLRHKILKVLLLSSRSFGGHKTQSELSFSHLEVPINQTCLILSKVCDLQSRE